MEPINPDNDFDKERAKHYNHVEYNQRFTRHFDKPIPQMPHFGPNWKYIAEKYNPDFWHQYKNKEVVRDGENFIEQWLDELFEVAGKVAESNKYDSTDYTYENIYNDIPFNIIINFRSLR
jgi:hypothetical protein